jgi:hypothetical protein
MTTREQSLDLAIDSELMCSMVEVSEENISDSAQTTDVAVKAAPNLKLILSYAHCGKVATLAQDPQLPAEDRAQITSQYARFRDRVTSGELQEQVDAWNEYRDFVRNLENKYPETIGTKSKYYSSIME